MVLPKEQIKKRGRSMVGLSPFLLSVASSIDEYLIKQFRAEHINQHSDNADYQVNDRHFIHYLYLALSYAALHDLHLLPDQCGRLLSLLNSESGLVSPQSLHTFTL